MQRQDIGPLLGQCSHLAKRRMLRAMQHFDFTPAQAQAMLFLIHNSHREETTQQALERHLKIRPSTANGVVARLVEKGFLTRVTGKADGRSRTLLLTEKGRKFEADFDQGICQAETVILDSFSEEERQTLRSLLLRVIQNLEEENNPC